MSRTQEELPRWEGAAVPSPAVESSPQPDGFGLERVRAGMREPRLKPSPEPERAAVDLEPADNRREINGWRDGNRNVDPTMVKIGFDRSELIDGPDARRSRRRQALLGMLAAGVTFGVALFVAGFFAGNDKVGGGGDGEGDDVVTVGSTAPVLVVGEVVEARPDGNRSGPILTVEVEVGSESG